MNYFCSPHDDDAALFGALTCIREQPTVVVVADSRVQPARGETGCSADERAAETEKAHAILGCRTDRFGLTDDDLTLDKVARMLASLPDVETVYVPALEGGHPQHDLVAVAAAQVFGVDKLRCYSTYQKLSQYRDVDLQPVGTTEIEWTREEYQQKLRALMCYESQMRVNPMHFRAVEGRSEWLSGYRRLHLGCGNRVWPGWINIDRYQHEVPEGCPPYFWCCDVNFDLPMVNDHSIDYVFSEDFLEHLPPDRRVAVMNEIHRVLVPGGVMEHYVPNAGSRNDYGSPTHLSHWCAQTFEHFDVDSHRWAKDRGFEGITCGFKKVSADLLNWQVEEDGVKRAQSLRVRYRKVAC
jgi:LmbE family N-acetylglucosaminyl deacetylase